MRPILIALAVAAGLAATLPASADAQRRSRDRLTREEIMGSSQKDLDLYAVIRALKPHFLEGARGTTTLGGGMQGELVVTVDGRRAPADVLRTLKASEIDEVRWLNPNRSQNEYGIRANQGAIQIKLYKGGPEPSKDSAKPDTARPDTTKPDTTAASP